MPDVRRFVEVLAILKRPNYRHSLKHIQALGVAREFNEEWGPGLRLLQRDCRHHTQGLAACLGFALDLNALV